MRVLIRTKEFDEFFNAADERVKVKIEYVLSILAEQRLVSTKIVKKLVNTDFYELRISVGNEYRVILFTIDSENIIEAKNILLLNGFIKKSTKDYKKEVTKAEKIIKQFEEI